MLWFIAASAFALPFDPTAALGAVASDARGGLEPAVERTVRFPGGARVRVGGRLDGADLRGELPVVATTADGAVRRVHGRLPDRIDRRPALVDADRATELAIDALRPLGAATARGEAARTWWVQGGEAHLAHAVALATLGDGPATWEVVIGAADGAVLALRRTSATAEARVYDPNPILADLSTVPLPAPDLLGPWADARSCTAVGDGTLFDLGVCGTWSRQAVPDTGGDYVFAPADGATHDPFAEVQAWYHADRMLTWLDATYGLRLPYGTIDLFVNFPLANAFFGDFDGDGQPDISFGHEPTTGVDFGYDADVVYHELGHAVVGMLAPDLPFLKADSLGMDWVSGSVNEGVADVFAMVLTGDPDVGEYAGSAFGRRAIRELGTLRTCPRALEGEVHADGEILGSMAWRLMQHPDVGPERVGDLAVGAIPLWGPDVTWAKVGESWAWAAGDLLDAGVLSEAGHEAVLATLAEAGLDGCERIDTLHRNVPRSFYLLSAGLEAPYDHIPSAAQVAIDVPVGADRWLVEELEFYASPGLGWSLVGRVGAPVEHTTLSLAGLAIATPTAYDWIVDVDSDQVVLGPDGDAPLVPGERLYLSITGRDVGDIEPLALAQGYVSFQILDDYEPVRAAPPRTNLEPEVVRACTHAGGRQGLGALGLALPWLLARRRRGRASGTPR